MNKSNDNEKVLSRINSIATFLPVIIIIIILVILVFVVIFNKGYVFSKPQTNEAALANVFIIISFIFILLIFCIALLPSFKELSKLFNQINSVTYIIIYTIFLILFFRLLPSNILNDYAYIITPVTLILSLLLFYKSLQTKHIENFNINYERIKTIILFFCLITICIVYYSVDPGGLIQKYYGTSSILTILLGVFAFLYLIVLLTLPEKYEISNKNESNNFLKNFSKFSVISSILFILFLVVITIIIITYPGGFLNDVNTSSIVLPFILIICILWSILLVSNLFQNTTTSESSKTKINLFKKSLLILFGFTFSCIMIAFIVYFIQNLSGQSSIVSFILNILLVIAFLTLIYKTINVKLPQNNSKKSAFFDIFANLFLYIPCLFSDVFDSIIKLFFFKYDSETTGSIILILVTISLALIYYYLPTFKELISSQGGKLLVDNPISIDTLNTLGNYQELNGSDKFNYQYAISFWVFIDSAPPSTSTNYSKYTSIMNFGEKPNVLYKASTNTLIITIQQKDLKENSNNQMLEFDDNGNRIIYVNNNFLLQKWNNIIINYNSGTLDIFLNGELVKSAIEVVPFLSLDSLIIGSNNGIKGGICNFIYYNKPLTTINIYYIYNSMKNKTPPAPKKTNKTIISN
jgi:hypothetical protein